MKIQKKIVHCILMAVTLALTACVSTEDFNLANDLKSTNDRLTELLSKAVKENTRSEKKDIELIAAYAHDTATQIASNGKNKLALGYYRIAAIGYWRDDIDENNGKFFEVISAAESICEGLDNKAPDRDCFVVRFTPYFTAVESIFLNPDWEATAASADQSETEKARQLLIDLGSQSSQERVVATNGHLVNLMVQAKVQQEFLRAHDSLNQYICSNVFASFDAYTRKYGNVLSAYTRLGIAQTLDQENPLIKEYMESPGVAGDTKIKAFIVTKVPSCFGS
jgi:hypothetical protein